jgi:hypothetical protein
MSNFMKFKTAVSTQLDTLSRHELFRVDIDKDELWEMYLNSFPEGTNPIYKERTENDCQCCKQFIRAMGNAVAIIDGVLVSVWDINVEGHYQVVADALSALIKRKEINNTFLHTEQNVGTDFNHDTLDDGTVIKWEHFHYKLPLKFVVPGSDIGNTLSNRRSNKEVLKRGLDEITVDALEAVLELIEQKSIYRGDEYKAPLETFLKYKRKYDALPVQAQDGLCWLWALQLGGLAKIRNMAIGTLLIAISEGVDLEVAVRSFEIMVAPTNYKRPTALITKGMIANAQKKVEELGISDSLQRRYAVVEDIKINNVLFADRSVKKALNVFEELASSIADNFKWDTINEVDVETFVHSILPAADSIELLLENHHSNNLMSLIAPVNEDSRRIFKWDNNFSWAYNGEVADSIKERVKKAGGNVNGVLRCSLSWFNYDDLDIHVREPDGNHIYYGNRSGHSTSGALDVDMNVSPGGSRNAVENIVWTDKYKMLKGIYEVFINNYSRRETIDVGFDVEIEFGGTIHTFHYDKAVKNNVPVAKFKYSKEAGIEFIESLPSTEASKEIWNITSQKFHKVSMIMNSPNHWDWKASGNKHLFFILEGCKNDSKARGFFNEFLKDDLREHRKVFEVLGSKMKTEMSDDQLSGLGFSSTQRNHIFCRVVGKFTRVIKINF